MSEMNEFKATLNHLGDLIALCESLGMMEVSEGWRPCEYRVTLPEGLSVESIRFPDGLAIEGYKAICGDFLDIYAASPDDDDEDGDWPCDEDLW